VRAIEVSDATYARLDFGARVAGVTISELLDRLTAPSGRPPSSADPLPAGPDEVRVFVTYRGHRVDGVLDLETDRLRITDGPTGLVGRSLRSPTQAAMEVVKLLNPDRERPETNGWRFWRDLETGQIIDRVHRR
jgi:hypothetical protein